MSLGISLDVVADVAQMSGKRQRRSWRRMEKSREAGFDHHLVKPVSPPELMKLLARILDQSSDRESVERRAPLSDS